MIGFKTKTLAGVLVISSIGLSTTAWAAQSMSNDSERVKKATTTQPNVKVQIDQPAPANAASGLQFKLTHIAVNTDGLNISQHALDHITAKYIGHKISMTDLNTMTRELTTYLRSHGYPAAAAYSPSQRISNGTLEVNVLRGVYGNITIDNKSKLQDSIIERITRSLKSNTNITTAGLESVLYRLNDIGGVKATGLLSPGSKTGTSDFTLHLEDTKNVRTILYAENYGTKAAGRYRYGLIDDIYNVDHHGEHLSVNGLISNDHMHNYGASWELPYGTSGTKAGISLSRTDYALGGSFRDMDAVGQSDNISLFASTPLLRTSNRSRLLKYGIDYHRLTDELRTYSYDVKRRSQGAHIGYEEIAHNAKNVTDYEATVSSGLMTMVSDYAKTNAAYNHADGRFTKGFFNVNSIQAFDKHWDLLVKAQGQLASQNLDSSEQFYLGGASGVRAYPQGEASGDLGYLTSAELRYHTKLPNLMLSTYYDGGYVRESKDGLSGNTHLRGWGVGLTYACPDDYFFRFDYARRIGLGDKLSTDAQSRQRMWFMAGKIW